MLLAAITHAADATGGLGGQERSDLEGLLKMPAGDAFAVLGQLLESVPQEVAAAFSVWHRSDEETPELVAGLAPLLQLPKVTAGELSEQAAVDAWASDATQGLIREFPLRIEPDTSLVMASALATRVRWQSPFTNDDVPIRSGSHWKGQVARLMSAALWDRMGVVKQRGEIFGFHEAVGDLGADLDDTGPISFLWRGPGTIRVLSVVGQAETPSERVFEVAAAISRALASADAARAVRWSPDEGFFADAELTLLGVEEVFDLPLGEHHMLTLSERATLVYRRGERACEFASKLPAWSASTGLTGHELPGLVTAGRALARSFASASVGEPVADASQQTHATFSREGFEGASVTAMGAAGGGPPSEPGVARNVTVWFDRPYAVIARVHQLKDRLPGPWHALPVFSAWVAEPDRDPGPARVKSAHELRWE